MSAVAQAPYTVTKLVDAVLKSDIDTAKRLIGSGVPVNELEDRMTPLLWAIFRGDVECVRVLLEGGADPNLRPNRTDSPLWHAEDDFGLIEIADLLKSYGATK
jgi:ankyrin repeat protein